MERIHVKRKVVLLVALIIAVLLAGMATAVTNDAIGGWTFDNANLAGGLAQDVSGNGEDMSSNTATTGATGIINQGFDYESSSSDRSEFTDLDVPGEGTISIWYKPESSANVQQLVEKRVAGAVDSTANYNLVYRNNQSFSAYVGNGATYGCVAYGNGGKTAGTQYHIVFTFSNVTGRCTLHVNDTLEVNVTLTGNPALNNGPLGTGEYKHTGGFNADGIIDELYIYNRVLTTSEISDLWNGGAGYQPYATSNFSITAKDAYNGTAITAFNATITHKGTTWNASTNATTLTTNITTGENANITIQTANYFTNSTINWNTSNNLGEALVPYSYIYYRKSDTNATISVTTTINGTVFEGATYGPYNPSALTAGNKTNLTATPLTETTTYQEEVYNISDAAENYVYLEPYSYILTFNQSTSGRTWWQPTNDNTNSSQYWTNTTVVIYTHRFAEGRVNTHFNNATTDIHVGALIQKWEERGKELFRKDRYGKEIQRLREKDFFTDYVYRKISRTNLLIKENITRPRQLLNAPLHKEALDKLKMFIGIGTGRGELLSREVIHSYVKRTAEELGLHHSLIGLENDIKEVSSTLNFMKARHKLQMELKTIELDEKIPEEMKKARVRFLEMRIDELGDTIDEQYSKYDKYIKLRKEYIDT